MRRLALTLRRRVRGLRTISRVYYLVVDRTHSTLQARSESNAKAPNDLAAGATAVDRQYLPAYSLAWSAPLRGSKQSTF